MRLSFLLPILVASAGLYLLVRLRFFFICHPIRTMGEFTSALGDRGARRSLCLALAGTLGVGNIFGVAAGIMIGGAGSLFWLFLSSIFAMIIKYAETLLTFDSKTARGGMAEVIRRVFVKCGDLLAPIYAVMTLALSLFIGSAMQSVAVLDVAEGAFSIHPVIGAVILIILLTPVLIGGARKIENITEIVIPLTTIIYIIMCFSVILINFHRIYEVIKLIISSAFSFRSAVGGLSFVAIKEGFARGILSNEAGAGTSAMAHSTHQGRTPHVAGLFAMCEVFFDSIVLCMLTGFAILLSVDNISAFYTPMSLVSAAFSASLGSFSVYILFGLVFAFAYSTLICWYFYGIEYSSLYFPKIKLFYPFLFLLFILVSRFLNTKAILYVIDSLLLIMTVMTLSAIVKKSNRIVDLSFKAQKGAVTFGKTEKDRK